MFCLTANYNAPHNNTPMLGVHAREARLACGFFCLQDYRPGSVIADVILPGLLVIGRCRIRLTVLGKACDGNSHWNIESAIRCPVATERGETNIQLFDDSIPSRVVVTAYC